MLLRTTSALVLVTTALMIVRPAFAAAPLHADSQHSLASFSIKHLLFSSVRGTMKITSVEIALQANSVLPESVDAVVDVGSLNTSEADRDKDLRSRNWFDVEHFPTMHFESTRIEATGSPKTFKAIGNLSMHGVTKPVTLNVTVGGDVKDDHGVRHVTYKATTSLDRRDFGVDAVKHTPGGGLLIGTGVAVTLDVDMVESG